MPRWAGLVEWYMFLWPYRPVLSSIWLKFLGLPNTNWFLFSCVVETLMPCSMTGCLRKLNHLDQNKSEMHNNHFWYNQGHCGSSLIQHNKASLTWRVTCNKLCHIAPWAWETFSLWKWAADHPPCRGRTRQLSSQDWNPSVATGISGVISWRD